MTEDEARNKWCPAARVSVGSSTSGNRTAATMDSRFKGNGCVASECMAWRQISTRDGGSRAVTGYCGLAGAL